MRRLIIFRGPSGSGKSTAAREWLNKNSCCAAMHFETDQYFIDKMTGEYNFDATKLGQAHGSCQRRVEIAMSASESDIVVSNTSMTLWELNPYLQMAKQYGYEVTVYRIKGPWDAEKFAARNAHGVPLSTVQKQISKYQQLENEEEYAG